MRSFRYHLHDPEKQELFDWYVQEMVDENKEKKHLHRTPKKAKRVRIIYD